MPAAAVPSTDPSDRSPSQTGAMPARDGTNLYFEWFEALRKRRGLALIVHGYAEHCGRYRETAEVLRGAGFATLSFDVRGHGRSEGPRGYTRRFRDYLDDFDTALARLDQLADDRELPVLVLAHSNGGLIALRSLSDPTRPANRVAAAVISSPFLGIKAHVPLPKQLIARVAGRYAPRLSLPANINIEHLTHDPDKLAERRADTLCNDNATARWYTAALRAHEYVRHNIVRVDRPTLWLVAGGDRVADATATRAVHARLRAPSEYHEFPDMHHEVLNEVGRERVFELIRAFADKYFSV